MHYQGKRHQKISEIHARKHSKKENFLQNTAGIIDKENTVTSKNGDINPGNPDFDRNNGFSSNHKLMTKSVVAPLRKSVDDSVLDRLHYRAEGEGASGSNNSSITESSTSSNTENHQNTKNTINQENLQNNQQNIHQKIIQNQQNNNQISNPDMEGHQNISFSPESNAGNVNFHEPPDPLPYYIKPFEKVLKKDHLYCPVCEVHVNSEAQMRQHRSSLRHMNLEKGLPVPPRVKDLELEKKLLAVREKIESESGKNDDDKLNGDKLSREKHESEKRDFETENSEKLGSEKSSEIRVSGNSSSIGLDDDLNLPKPMQYKCEVCNCILNSTIQLHQHLASSRHKSILEGKAPKPRWMPYHKYRKFKTIVCVSM